MVRWFADIYNAVVTAFKGMGVTIKHFFRKPVTLQYPDERWVLPPRFRGFVYNDIVRCNACMGCAKACPVNCIYIETEGKGKERFMTRWAVDYNKCIWCGFCVDPCPTEAVQMSHDYDHSLYFRQKLVYEFVPADKPVPCHKEVRKEMGYFVEEKAARAEKAPAAAKAAAPAKAPAAAGAGTPEKPAAGAPDRGATAREVQEATVPHPGKDLVKDMATGDKPVTSAGVAREAEECSDEAERMKRTEEGPSAGDESAGEAPAGDDGKGEQR